MDSTLELLMMLSILLPIAGLAVGYVYVYLKF